jgi:hypothetical protein
LCCSNLDPPPICGSNLQYIFIFFPSNFIHTHPRTQPTKYQHVGLPPWFHLRRPDLRRRPPGAPPLFRRRPSGVPPYVSAAGHHRRMASMASVRAAAAVGWPPSHVSASHHNLLTAVLDAPRSRAP